MSETFQARVKPWMMECFGATISGDITERCDRFIEEAFELVQSLHYDPCRIMSLASYVFNRPEGEPFQESGGVTVTHAALCLAIDIDMHEAAEAELARIWTKVDQIREKQAGKPVGSALPIASLPAPQIADNANCLVVEAQAVVETAAAYFRAIDLLQASSGNESDAAFNAKLEAVRTTEDDLRQALASTSPSNIGESE